MATKLFRFSKSSSETIRHCCSAATSIPRLCLDSNESAQQRIPEPIANRPLRGQRRLEVEPSLSPNSSSNALPETKCFSKLNPGSNHGSEVRDRRQSTIDSADGGSDDLPSAPENAEAIFQKMKETGLIPNAVAMLDGLCKDGLVHEAMKLFGSMREKGSIPEVVAYTAVVEGFCKANQFEDAKRVFMKMKKGIVPNAFSYHVLIQGLVKGNLLDDAMDFCIQMVEAQHSPNPTTLVGLVEGVCNNKGVGEASVLIKTLKQKGFLMNEKAVRDYLEKNAPLDSPAWEAIFGKKPSRFPL